ncbi:histidine kinase N-terminal 7TM domain-containing protein [Halorientalis brevis]|uniref:histidine kinase n=1 Tax=Halorientalis brevis TaxID=1126241 RepID=A0ABD6CCU8_9EURY|nr:histidine kinase N-terminal 7TM domain-containing protein [Halorientalis brevis]
MVSPLLSFALVWGSITAAAALTVLAWRQRPKAGAEPFAVLMAAGTWWVATSSIGLFTLDAARRLLLHKLEWAGLIVIPLAWILFALEYTSRDEYLTKRTVALLAVIPVVTFVLAMTTDSHGLVYASRAVHVYGDVSIVELSTGPWFWVYTAYAYVLMGVGTLLMLQLIGEASALYRTQAVALLITVLAPWAGNVVFISGLSPVRNFDPTPFMFLISGATGIAALTQFKLLDALPVTSRIARETVIESMDDGVVVVDANDRIVDINRQAASILDCSDSAVIDAPAGEIVPAYERLRTADDPDHCETVEFDRANGTHYYELSMTGLRDDRQRGAVVSIHDVTNRRNRVKQLDVLNRVLRHNLRNEMNVVYGYADQLDDGDAVDRIQEKAMTMVNLGNKAREIDQMLNDDQDGPPIEISDIVEIEVDRARDAHPGVTFELSCPDTDRLVPRTIGSVLRNLIENAAKHNDADEPRVTVDVTLDADTATVDVRDNGPGIPDEERAVLRRGDETPLKHSNGLGLWLVNWGVQTMGGSVSVESRAERGTVVRVEVPTVPPQAAVADE